MGSLNSMKEVDWIGLWKPGYKISPDVYETVKNTSTSEGIALDGNEVSDLNELPQPENEYIVTLFRGEDISSYIEEVRSLGGVVHNYTFDRMYIHIDKSKLPQIAALKGVYFIGRRYLMGPINDRDTWIIQTLTGVPWSWYFRISSAWTTRLWTSS